MSSTRKERNEKFFPFSHSQSGKIENVKEKFFIIFNQERFLLHIFNQ